MPSLEEKLMALNEMPHLSGIRRPDGTPAEDAVFDLYLEHYDGNGPKDCKGAMEFMLRLLDGLYWHPGPGVDKYNNGARIEVSRESVRKAIEGNWIFVLQFRRIYENAPEELVSRLPGWFRKMFTGLESAP